VVVIGAPFSYIFVYASYGYEGLQIRSLMPPSEPPKSNSDEPDMRFHDPENPPWVMNAAKSFTIGAAMMTLKLVLIASFCLHDRTGKSNKAPEYWYLPRSPI